MRGAWATLAAGALLMIVAVTGFVIVPQHRPGSVLVGQVGGQGGINQALCQADGPSSSYCPHGGHFVPVGWARSLFDLLRIATWACVIAGLILVLVGLILTWRRSSTHQTPTGAS